MHTYAIRPVNATTRIRWVYDESFEPDHSGCPDFGDADLKRDQDKLASGEWVALGGIVEVLTCARCQTWKQTEDGDSLWGFLDGPPSDETLDEWGSELNIPEAVQPPGLFDRVKKALKVLRG